MLSEGTIVKIVDGPRKGKIGVIKGQSGRTYIVQTNEGVHYEHVNHVRKA